MVEAIANSIEDKLVDGLSFKLNPGASYVVDRRSVTYHPQGSNIYSSSTGTKLIRIMLTGDNWLDPSTFRVMFNLKNDDTDALKRLRPIGAPWAFFQRLRVLCGGQLVEDITEYNRIHHMMHLLIAKESRENDSAEAFGVLADAQNWSNEQLSANILKGIAKGDSMTVMFKPLSGILSQNKMIPIRYAPLVLELELVSDETLPVVSNFTRSNADDIKATNTTTKWSIDNVQVKCDVCTLDNALDNSYAQHLLSGKSLPISYNTFVSQIQTVTGPDVTVNVSRALTRLKSVFVTFQKDYKLQRALFLTRKSWNDFFSPMSSVNVNAVMEHSSKGEFDFQLQIGSKLFPEYPVRSHAEAYYQLKKTLGVQASAVHNFDVSGVEFRDHKFILGTDCEKILDAGFTGINTRAGDLMTVKFKNASTQILTENDTIADRLHVVLHSDQIMEIRDTGVAVFD
jgi:hypothetical protein